MWAKLRDSSWMLPALSAALLVLAFHPFDLWPLAFIALTPLYYFVAAAPQRGRREVFWGGFITGSVFALSLSYFTVLQFKWVPEAHLFTDLVHLSFIPIGILGGLLCGGFCTLAYRYLRTRSPALNMLAGAGAFTAGEMLLYWLCGGYYFAMLGYAAAGVPFLISFASMGGAFAVTFLVALVNSAIAEGLALPRDLRRRFIRDAALLAGAVVAAYGSNSFHLSRPAPQEGALTVRVLQSSSRDAVSFGGMEGASFVFPALEERLRAATADGPDLLIYPFSPVEGAFYEGERVAFNKPILVAPRTAFLSWTKGIVPASTTLMVWTTLYEEGKFHNVFEYVRNGQLTAEYRKRALFPFIDYTPQWAQRIGFFTTQIDQGAGEDTPLFVAGIPAAGMLCSEIHKQDLARTDSTARLIVSAGSEAMFTDDVASEYSLKAAQFRAAETHRPAIRANLLGPSALIGSDGTVQVRLNRGAGGELSGTIALHAPRTTLYALFGHLPLILLLLAILGAVFAVRRRARYKLGND